MYWSYSMAINNIQERYNSLRFLLVGLIRDQVGLTTIIADQAAPRPQTPYCSLRFFSSTEEKGFPEKRMDENGQEYLIVNVEFRVEVSVFTDSETRFDNNNNVAYTLVESIKNTLSLEPNKIAFKSQHVPYIDGGLITSGSVILNTTFEPKAICTFRFRSAVVADYDTGAIETVELNSAYGTGQREVEFSTSVNKN